MDRAMAIRIESSPQAIFGRIRDRTVTGIFAGLCGSLTVGWVALLAWGGTWLFGG